MASECKLICFMYLGHNLSFFSKNFLSRCIPDTVTDQVGAAGGLFSDIGASNFVEEVMGDLQQCGPQLAQMGLVALVFSLIVTLLFRFLAGWIVYAIIGGVIAVLLGGTITLWVLWFIKKGGKIGFQRKTKVRIALCRRGPDRQCHKFCWRRGCHSGEQFSSGRCKS